MARLSLCRKSYRHTLDFSVLSVQRCGRVVIVPLLWPLLVYIIVVLILVAGMLGVSYVLGQRHRETSTDVPYESGMTPTGSARLRFPADFYLVGMFFVIFDLEVVFAFAWAIAARALPRELRWIGYAEILIFIVVLLVGLVYLWRSGALDWGRSRRAPSEKGEQTHAALP